MSLFEKILGDPNAREIKRMQPIVDSINQLEPTFEALSNDALKAKTQEFKERLKKGETLDDLLPEAFAATREAAKRTIGKRHYDVQLIAGIVLHRGNVAEMRTGEGKTLAATLPAYLNALTGNGVHIVTVNDYLAKRDSTWMGSVYNALGMSVGCIQQLGHSYIYEPGHTETVAADEQHGLVVEDTEAVVTVDMEDLRSVTRQEAYAADITHGTNNEFGFDYLRDNMAQRIEDQTQHHRAFSIVDEVDSILIDEARTPLIISAPAAEATQMYQQFARLIPQLAEGEDYNVDEKMKASTLTEEGIRKIEKLLGIENLYAEGGMRQVHHLEQALKARALFQKDKDYVVKDGEVVIVDEFTGRLMHGRRYSDGLHQAIEAKENVQIQQESITMATITFQNYFRMYDKLSGMTGTAKTEEEEFAKIYGLSVLEIPTNKPVIRDDKNDFIFRTEKGKFEAVVAEVKKKNELGQPVLIGTASIEKNEILSTLFNRAGIKHEMLNAKNHEREAEIIAQAGRVGGVTIATNMAGRGVDVILGGNPIDEEQSKAVKNLGGLHVIGTERHESRRIDNQLRGRSGRQGDVGSSQFFISTEDDLSRIFAGDRLKGMMDRLNVPENEPIENALITKLIESAQKKVEGHNFDLRKHVVQYDDVINKQREVIYRWRQNILKNQLENGSAFETTEVTPGPDTAKETLRAAEEEVEVNADKVLDMVEDEIAEVVNFHTQSEREGDWNLDEIYEVIDTIYPVPIEVRLKIEDIYDKLGGDSEQSLKGREALIHYLVKLSEESYEALEKQIESAAVEYDQKGIFKRLENSVLLRSIDTLWVEHLDAMDHLRQGIGLRGYGQRDPLVEYKKESFHMFEQLQVSIRKQVVYSIYKLGQTSGLPNRQAEQRNLQFQGAEKTSEKGHGQFAATMPQAASAPSGTAAGPPTQTAAIDQFARKQAGGVRSAPVIPGQKKKKKKKKR